MSSYTRLMFVIQGFFWVVVLALLIYLVVRRVRISRKEDFDKRDN